MNELALSIPRQKVLLVDDEPCIVDELAEFLEGYDIPCVLAGSGEAAIAILPRPDITRVVLDLRMEGVDGFAVLDAMKGRLAEGLRVAVISGHATPADEAAAMDRGAALFLRKPFDPQMLISSGFLTPPESEAGPAKDPAPIALAPGKRLEKRINDRLRLVADVRRVWTDSVGVHQVCYDYRVLRGAGAVLDSGRRSASAAMFNYMFPDG
ncbi:MAG: hypothetical protein RL477_1201 [Pseudomonadota bacterium]|jgi:CheY-like chemotaxis protein